MDMWEISAIQAHDDQSQNEGSVNEIAGRLGSCHLHLEFGDNLELECMSICVWWG